MSKNTLLSELINYVSYDGTGKVTVTTGLTVNNVSNGSIDILPDFAQNYLVSYAPGAASQSKLVVISDGISFRPGWGATIFMDVDASGNVGVGGAANGSFKFNVTGTARVTGVLTLGSTISNGTFTYTLPGATGTLALTSALASYLPLSGGTLTGALSGTSATFSSNTGIIVGANSRAFIRQSTGGDAEIGAPSGGTLSLFNNGSSALSFAASGAATFSSSVTTTSLTATGSSYIQPNALSNNVGLFIQNNNTGGYGSTLGLGLYGYNTSAYFNPLRIEASYPGYGLSIFYVKSQSNSSEIAALTLNGNGNVGIGTTAPSVALEVNGASNLASRGRYVKTSEGILQLGANRGTSNCPYIGSENAYDFAFITNDTERMRITSGGALLIGITSANGKVNIAQDQGSNNQFLNFTGTQSGYSQEWGFGIVNNSRDFRLYDYTSGNERLRVNLNGHLLIGTTSDDPSGFNTQGIAVRGDGILIGAKTNGYAVDFGRIGSDGELFRFRRGGTVVGTISVTGSATAYNTSSDYRLKQDLKSYNGLDLVNKINTYDYEWKSDNTRAFGVLAHELAEVLPYAVLGIKDGEEMQSVDYSKIVPVMVQAIKDLKAELDTLKNK